MLIKHFLEQLNPQNKRILDVGTYNGKFIEFLKDKNSVTGIDIKTGQDIRTYPLAENEYDIIIARNVLPFLSSKQEIFDVVEKMYQGASEYLFFTLFGENDPWAKDSPEMTFINDEDAMALKKKYPVVEFHYTYGEGGTLAGGTKLWEKYIFIIKK